MKWIVYGKMESDSTITGGITHFEESIIVVITRYSDDQKQFSDKIL
ncbi:MAG TPA: hypothetical protein VE818_07715 [Nitrososphaeraceae archaeon]|nr:hypothetical protein [Nitrososphaeraceae archaeon]